MRAMNQAVNAMYFKVPDIGNHLPAFGTSLRTMQERPGSLLKRCDQRSYDQLAVSVGEADRPQLSRGGSNLAVTCIIFPNEGRQRGAEINRTVAIFMYV